MGSVVLLPRSFATQVRLLRRGASLRPEMREPGAYAAAHPVKFALNPLAPPRPSIPAGCSPLGSISSTRLSRTSTSSPCGTRRLTISFRPWRRLRCPHPGVSAGVSAELRLESPASQPNCHRRGGGASDFGSPPPRSARTSQADPARAASIAAAGRRFACGFLTRKPRTLYWHKLLRRYQEQARGGGSAHLGDFRLSGSVVPTRI